MKQLVKDVLVNHSSFESLEVAISQLELTKDKGDAFEFVAATYFEYFDRKFEVKNVFMRSDIPNEVASRLKLEGTDYGVDGVIERIDGKFTAYQVKFRSGRESPSFRELSTFWTEAEHADYRLVFANCDNLPRPVSNRTNHLAVLCDALSELDETKNLPKGCFFEFLTARVTSSAIRQHSFAQPRDYQQEMLYDIVNELQVNDRTKVIAACGVGKTLLAKFIHDSLGSNLTLFMAPSLALIKQALDEWNIKTEKQFIFLAVCSDESVTTSSDEIRISSHEVSFPVTTNPTIIQEFISFQTDLPKVIFSTYHSLDSIVMASIQNPIQFDLGIFDEAHKTAGSKLSKQFTLAMEDEYIHIKKRIFMTATERVVTKKIQDSAASRGHSIYSMDDIEKYGKVSANLNFGRAIKKGIIADYKIVVASITEAQAHSWMRSKNIVSADNSDIGIESLFKKLLVVKAMKELGITKVLSYHSNISRAQDFTSTKSSISLQTIFNNIIGESSELKVTFDHVNGSMSSANRKKVLDRLSNSDLGVVSNAKCLTEGVNVPVVDAIYFADQKSSLIDIVQAVGRAVRKINGQAKTAYVILPVVIPSDASSFSGINSSNFEAIHDAIQALREADEDLAELIDEVNYSISTGGNSGNGSALDGKVLHLSFGELPIASFEQSINLRIGEINTKGVNDTPLVTYSSEKGSRKSSFKRKLTTIGDYNIDAYLDMVIPTVKKYISRENQILQKKELELIKNDVVNHNNISHTERLGAIIQTEKGKYKLTEIGRLLLSDSADRNKIFINQMLRYSTYDKNAANPSEKFIFPYRAIMEIARNFDYIRKLDFLYCIYALPNTSSATINSAIMNIKHLQESFPNLETLSDSNKTKVLDILNEELLEDGAEFSLLDVWSSRGTTYNQFNYFKKHLQLFEDIFVEGASKDRIYLKAGHKTAIDNFLDATKDTFETALRTGCEVETKEVYTKSN